MTVRRRVDRTKAPRMVAAPFRCRLVVMAKAPMAGRVKQRLARDIGVTAATRFARHALVTMLARVRRPHLWHTAIAAAPDSSVSQPVWPSDVDVLPQGRGDLGARMQRIFDTARPGPVVIIGTDIPGVHATHIYAAFRLLGQHDVVVGPARDGGYWLIGVRRRPRVLRPFANVRWSTAHALADTLQNISGRSVARLPTLQDVDDARDLAAHEGLVGRRVARR